ncbi:chemotaxis-specific protein-glutamate methyltransferase CheB [Patulibacter defluvii]|uniref:chemotaxis-specific protein-glutamate methyltransferase CheB n=1 Tax=Patulibacter defluvii TaxID=3095358 RepID=UPI002A75CDB6|nr:chemotaxis-specific protein-glutamate methyltransferase CheB [Patulibacter sp. DM4]
MAAHRPLRVVLADDSSFMRALVGRALADAGFDVVGRARDGHEALALCRELRPDVLTLDLAMPGLGGLDVLRRIAGGDGGGTPVVVVSAFSPADGARAVDALTGGAFDLVPKPEAGGLAAFARELAATVRAAAAGDDRPGPAALPVTVPAVRRSLPTTAGDRDPVLVVACSTGGPRALATLVPALPPRVGGGALVVQHMPAGFTRSLAERLDRGARVRVREAADGDRLDPATVLVAPGGRHLRLDGDALRLDDEPPVGGLRPRADLTIADVARRHGERVLLVVLTGMGRDGSDGARAVRRHGGRVLVEAAATCTVHGMPRAVAEAGLADAELPIDELAATVATALRTPAVAR